MRDRDDGEDDVMDDSPGGADLRALPASLGFPGEDPLLLRTLA